MHAIERGGKKSFNLLTDIKLSAWFDKRERENGSRDQNHRASVRAACVCYFFTRCKSQSTLSLESCVLFGVSESYVDSRCAFHRKLGRASKLPYSFNIKEPSKALFRKRLTFWSTLHYPSCIKIRVEDLFLALQEFWDKIVNCYNCSCQSSIKLYLRPLVWSTVKRADTPRLWKEF